MTNYQIPITTEVTEQDIENLIVTAVEHMGYGCLTYHAPGHWGHNPDHHPLSIRIAQDLLDGREVRVTDRWDYGEEGTLTLDGLLRGIGQRAEQRGLHPASLIEDADVEDADCIVQYALWNKIVLG